MRTVFDFVRVIAGSESNVLIVGETGTGKETIAGLIHQSSARRRRPFVPVSCAILTETLIESELFGHERGAFTGALREHPGRFELADGGTIFLDDIDDVPRSIQVKLLRVLQNRTIERVGGTRAIPVDVRVITGSKRSLQQLAAEGLFREDLCYRLDVVPIGLPPLREREDIRADRSFPPTVFATGRGRARPLAGRPPGLRSLRMARGRARARERVRAHRPDVHLPTVRAGHAREPPVSGRRRPADRAAAAGSARRARARVAGREAAGSRDAPHRLGARREPRQQVSRGRAAAHQAFHARRPHPAARARSPGGRQLARNLNEHGE
jgi:hypothetical protein